MENKQADDLLPLGEKIGKQNYSIQGQWEAEAEKIQPYLKDIEKQKQHYSKLPHRVLKVNQLDAIIIDQELNEILKLQFNKIFSLFPGISGFGPELSLILDLLLFRLSVWSRGTTYGNNLQGLKYKVSTNVTERNLTLLAYLLLNVIIPYVFNRLSLKARQWISLSDDDPKKKLWYFLTKCDEIWKYLTFINFIIFLYDGKYVNLANRLLGLRLVYEMTRARTVSFDFMNRQLLWNGFTEFMFFLMPTININSIKDFFGNIFSKLWGGDGSLVVQGKCLICNESCTMPYCDESGNCHHQFCYYCLKEKIMEQGKYKCPADGVKIKNIKRYQPDFI